MRTPKAVVRVSQINFSPIDFLLDTQGFIYESVIYLRESENLMISRVYRKGLTTKRVTVRIKPTLRDKSLKQELRETNY